MAGYISYALVAEFLVFSGLSVGGHGLTGNNSFLLLFQQFAFFPALGGGVIISQTNLFLRFSIFIFIVGSICYHAATRTGQTTPICTHFEVSLVCCFLWV